jgi:tetratricopeptide (TPR) repeat protein
MEEIMGKDVMIKRRVPGDGDLAEYGTIVKCNLKGYFFSCTSNERLSEKPFEIVKDQEFQIGEGDAIPALELGLRHSRKGEKLTVYCSSRFGFGFTGRNYKETGNNNEVEKKQSSIPSLGNGELSKEGSPRGANSSNAPKPIPPNTDLEYEIEILSHRTEKDLNSEFREKYESALNELPSNDKNDPDKKSTILNRILTLQSLTIRKESGNRWFSYGDYQRASKAYSRATQISEGYFNTSSPAITSADLENTGEDGEPDRNKALQDKLMDAENKKRQEIHVEDTEIVNVYVSCLNNLAACKLGQKEFSQAKELCTKVLGFSPFNAKALLRAAKASLATDVSWYSRLCIILCFFIMCYGSLLYVVF